MRKIAKVKPSGMDPRKLDRLIEEAVVDAYNESEKRTSLYTMLDERLEVPFKTEVLGVEVTVEHISRLGLSMVWISPIARIKTFGISDCLIRVRPRAGGDTTHLSPGFCPRIKTSPVLNRTLNS